MKVPVIRKPPNEGRSFLRMDNVQHDLGHPVGPGPRGGAAFPVRVKRPRKI